MYNNLINIQENISSIQWTIKEEQIYLKEQKEKLKKEFNDTDLFKEYKNKYNKVELDYIDEETMILICDGLKIEIENK